MIHEGKNNIGGTAINKALVVDETAEMFEEECIDMLCAVRFMRSMRDMQSRTTDP